LIQFETPKQSLAGLSIETNAALLAAAADVVLVIADDGVIQDVAVSTEELPSTVNQSNWIGKSWSDIVTVESKSKISRLLKETNIDAKPIWRQINIPIPRGVDLPFSFCAVPVGPRKGLRNKINKT